jgi:TRAP-type C4-dicarboxylate transport system permease small subunit
VTAESPSSLAEARVPEGAVAETGLGRALSLLDRLLELVATISFSIVFFGLFLAVMLRYVFDLPIVWSEELAGVAAAWMVFCGAAVAVFRAEHITVDIFMRLPIYAGALRRTHETFAALAILSFGAALAVSGATIALASWNRTLPALGWPYSIHYLASCVGGGAIALFAAYRLFRPCPPQTPIVDSGGD